MTMGYMVTKKYLGATHNSIILTCRKRTLKYRCGIQENHINHMIKLGSASRRTR